MSRRYWTLVCNPRKWAVDRFLEQGLEYDTWGVRPSDAPRMGPGDLCVLRVGVDRRPERERHGRPQLASGIYALCEISSAAFESYGTSRELWAEAHAPTASRPTVLIRYARTFLHAPLTIERLRERRPELSKLLLEGFQGSTFGITREDFEAIAALLGTREAALLAAPADAARADGESAAAPAAPAHTPPPRVVERVVRQIERGPEGDAAKRLGGYRCQLCAALGRDPIGFRSRATGEPYVEAHHVVPVATLAPGTLGVDNIMTLCATHHRQLHHGEGVDVAIEPDVFVVTLPEGTVRIGRPGR